MAIEKSNASLKMTLRVVKGTDLNGKALTVSRSVAGLNPALSDDDFVALGAKYAALQAHELDGLRRTEAADLVEQA